MVQFISPALLDYYANGRVQSRCGNRSSYASPHGAFPCKGEDSWCALAVFDEVEWQALRRTMGDPAWARAGKFSTLSLRQSNEDELESLISQWTITYARDDLVAVLQEAGVASGPVQDASDLVDLDPQLRQRESFVKLTHPVIGECNHPAPALKLSKSPSHIKTSPCLGEHNEYVLFELLGISDEEFVELLNEGVLE
jgi:crotonobetainyl-CoA:carnitine CoA-transferase CaiB-like acyl-CoA transferase